MPLQSGKRLGPYEIQSPIGAGGMGEVYKARDTRLDRTVAIKVLPAELASDPQFRDRFEREARTISQLDHQHICALYDVGEEQGTSFLVMQYLEGETLADRMAKAAGSALPVEEALSIAIQIADALDKAHRAGIVHRDVKPGNIMLTKAGAKLLDFGLARSGAPVLASSGLSMLPTTPANLTAQGTILGTFQYMAPEQLEGQEADARTDIFAFGAVLYEMLTGKKAFQGKSHATLIASIVGSEPPPISVLQPIAPPVLDDIVRICLAKNPDARWQSAGDLLHALALTSRYKATAATAVPKRGTMPKRIAWALAAVCAIAATMVAGWLWLGRTTAEAAKVTFDIATESAPSPLHLALSPDGTRLVAIGFSQGGSAIWVRRLDQVAMQTLAGTTGAAFPFWSPDGRFIAFFASGKLNKIDIFGGPAQPLCDSPLGHGGTWSRKGVIVFAPSASGPLSKVSAGGGIPEQITELDKSRGDLAHRHPKFLPDGNHFVFFVSSGKAENSGLYLGALDSKETRRLVASDAMGAFVPPDHLLFMRESTLMAQQFDAGRLELQGDPFPVAEGVGINPGNSVAGFAFSDTGMLAFRLGGSKSERVLRWVDRAGKPIGDVGAVGPHENVALEQSGERLAETRLDGLVGDIWVFDLSRGTPTRFTFDPAIDDNPIWSPDGSRIVFASGRDGVVRNLYVKSSGGAGQDELLLKTDGSKFPTDWSRDGKYILYTELKSSPDVWVLPLSGDKKPMPFLNTPFSENRARFSPDGRWIAYTSDESGVGQIYVQSFPPSGGKWQISATGGVEPHWRGDGRELFYFAAGAVWSVDVSASGPNSFKAGTPKKLFDAGVVPLTFGTRYDVTPDGQRLLLNLSSTLSNNATPPIRVISQLGNGTPTIARPQGSEIHAKLDEEDRGSEVVSPVVVAVVRDGAWEATVFSL